ncbi:MAG TPA: nitrilase-related carbon-nitrogen hydrolase, partial [Polyangia bacterium]
MRLVRIAICNVNTTVGAVKSNVDRALELGRAAAADDATVVAYPEQLVSGYPPEDLVQWRSFVEAQRQELQRFATATAELASLFVVGVTVERGAGVYNCAALVHRGRVLGFVPKEKLPTYNVFYEGRTFSRGAPGLYDEVHGTPFGDLVFDVDFGTLALEVCEDIWSPDGPMRRRCYAGAELVVNVSASPYRLGVVDTRREMICTRAGDNQCVVAYAALVGANDNLVFDGGGYVAQNGRLVHSAPRFREGFSAVTVDLDRTTRLRREITTWRTDQETFAALAPRIVHVKVTEPTADRSRLRYPAPAHQSFFLPPPSLPRQPRVEFCEDLLDALAMGLGDYFTKIGVFKTIGVALSGGRDSLLCLIIAHRWATKNNRDPREVLRAFFMPTRYSSAETRAAAERAAAELDVPLA